MSGPSSGNQQKILGKAATDEEEQGAPHRVLASRANVAMSIPMLFFMAGGWSHRAVRL
jgi:hypothetical protein